MRVNIMKMIITLVLTLTISVVRSVDVYVFNGYEFYDNRSMAKPEPSPLFRFAYHAGDILSMQIYIKNEAVDVSSEVYLNNYPPGGKMRKMQLQKYVSAERKYFIVRSALNYSKINIELHLYTVSSLCSRIQIVEGQEVTGISDDRYHIPYNNICLKNQWCVIEVDLLNNECGVSEGTNSQPTQTLPKIALMYVIPSVAAMCAIVVIYIIVKKYCHRNAQPVHTEEALGLNTNATASEVTYAELCLVGGTRQPSRHDEESPYAEIVGVLKPR